MIRMLAQTIDRDVYLRSMHQQFSNSNPNLWREILLGVTIVASLLALAWLAWLWQRWRGQQTELKPLSLYRSVLSRTGLPTSDVWRLWRLAKVVQMPHPTAMLISEQLFDEAVEKYCVSGGWLGSRKSAAGHFATIRARLFSE